MKRAMIEKLSERVLVKYGEFHVAFKNINY